MKRAYLILEDGTIFRGSSFGAEAEALGEIVFTTAMTGYLETLTDPSYYGQIVLHTFPLIGNYGVIPEDFESDKISLSAYIVKYPCYHESNFRSVECLDSLLKKRNIPGLCNIDTRMLTRIIRSKGVMNGKITYSEPKEKDRLDAASYTVSSPIMNAALKAGIKETKQKDTENGEHNRIIALLDYGAKKGIEDALLKRNCFVKRYAYNASVDEILSINPSGVLLSNGPGDPQDKANAGIIDTIKEIDKKGIPIFGICLGHQLLALAKGLKTSKMKFGHRGANQPVKDMSSGKVYITSQNHGYAVDIDDCSNFCNSFVNVNDGSNEGLDYGLSFSVQFHPEAQGGPLDTSFLFDRFMERIDRNANR